MATITIIGTREAKSTLSQLVRHAAAGETILICPSGKPAANLLAAEVRPQRRLGLLRGKLSVPKDFDAPVAEIPTLFEGGTCSFQSSTVPGCYATETTVAF